MAAINVLVLGLGNILLSDEGVGVRIVEALQERHRLPDGVEALDGGTSGMELLGTIAERDHVIVCDAVARHAPPATVVRLAGGEVPVWLGGRLSPHQLGLADVLATLALAGEAPKAITLIGVTPSSLDLGIELSPEVARAADRAVELVVEELKGLGLEVGRRPEATAA